MALKIRRGLAADRTSITPVEGELVYTTDTKQLYIGDGATAGGNLITGASGSGTVSSAGANQIAFYDNAGTTVSGIGPVTWDGSRFDIDSPLSISAIGAEKLRLYSYPNDSYIETPTDVDLIIHSRIIDFGGGTRSNRIRIFNEGTSTSLAYLSASVTSAENPNLLTLNRRRGTNNSPLAVVDNDKLFDLRFTGFDGTADQNVGAIRAEAHGTVSAGKVPGRLRFLTSNTTGSLSTAFTVDNDQIVRFTSGIEMSTATQGLTLTNTEETHNQYSTNSVSRNVYFNKHRGTSTAPAVVVNNDTIYSLRFQGWDGSALQTSAMIRADVNGTPSNGIVPGRLRFFTMGTDGVLQAGLTISRDQLVAVPNNLQVNGAFENGQIRINGNIITTYVSNANLELSANGTGKVLIEGIRYPNTDGTNGQVLTTNGAGVLSWTTVSGASTGAVTFTGSIIDTNDSSSISFTPAVVFNSDVLVDNDLRVSNRVYAEEFVSTSVGTPKISSATNIDLEAGVAVRIQGGTLRLNSLTTSARDLLVPVNGDTIYNSTTNQVEFYQNGSWSSAGGNQLNDTLYINGVGKGITFADSGTHTIGALSELDISSGASIQMVSLGTIGISASGPIEINSGTGSNPVTVKNGSFILEASLPPATASSTGTRGTIAWDADYFYVCTATNTWKRAALTTWP